MNRAETLPSTGSPKPATGVPHSRVDGPVKVTGAAQYAAEFCVEGLVYGVVVSGTIATGKIVSIDTSAAEALSGVLLVLTHRKRPALPSDVDAFKDMVAPGGTPLRPLWDERVWYSGQPVALVVAQSLELARYAASLVQVRYEAGSHQTDIEAALTSAVPPSAEKGGFDSPPPERGDPRKALAAAKARVDAFYTTPPEYHNPLEMHGCTVVPDVQGRLTVYEKTQGVVNTKGYLTRVFGLKDDEVHVVSPFVGGAFGSGLRPQYHLALAVMAARELKKPVRVTLTRQQMFTFAHRPQTVQRVALGASADGRLQAVIHEAVSETSRYEDYCDVVVDWAGQLYRCDNVSMGYRVAKLDVPTPADMRAPGATQGLFALEVAMDELAEALRMDPLELRLVNYAERDANRNLPFSSKALRDCYREGAARFGWAGRPLEARARRDGNELIGWGMATGAWDAMQNEAAARAVLTPDGRVSVSSSTADIGTGTYTAMTQIAADALGVPLGDVSFELGDTRLPRAPIEGGSWTVSSVGSAVDAACTRLHNRLVELAREHGGARFASATREHVRRERNRLVCGATRGRLDRDCDAVAARRAGRTRRAGQREAARKAAGVFDGHAFGGVRRSARRRRARHRAGHACGQRGRGRTHRQSEDGGQSGRGRHRVGHQHGAARARPVRSRARTADESQPRRISYAGECRHSRDRRAVRRRAR
ncbi:xanthine dehydrogenase YagR molybdenum-binding subunit [Paraburkholderia sp. UCT70]